jgi:hypothetical protein
MLIKHIFREAVYTTSRSGIAGEYIRIGVWYNAKTGVVLDAHRKNHAELVATEPAKFGISRAEMAAVRKHEDFELDWNEPVIKLANAHGWVRVMAEGHSKNLELNIQSSIPADALKAARHFADELAPTTIYIDLEVTGYNNVWHTKLQGNDLERYLKTGRFPK